MPTSEQRLKGLRKQLWWDFIWISILLTILGLGTLAGLLFLWSK